MHTITHGNSQQIGLPPTQDQIIADAARELVETFTADMDRVAALAPLMTDAESEAFARLIGFVDPLPQFLQFKAGEWTDAHLAHGARMSERSAS